MTTNPPDFELPPRTTPWSMPWDEFLQSDGLLWLDVQQQGDVWAAAFRHAYVTEDNRKFWAVSGHGDSPDSAVLDYRRWISGRTIAIQRHPQLPPEKSPSNQLIQVPYWPELFEPAA